MALHFPNFPANGSIWITEVIEHEIEACEAAFYRAARSIIEQAYSLVTSSPT